MFKIKMKETKGGFSFQILKTSKQDKNSFILVKEFPNLSEEQSVKLFNNFFDDGFTVEIVERQKQKVSMKVCLQ